MSRENGRENGTVWHEMRVVIVSELSLEINAKKAHSQTDRQTHTHAHTHRHWNILCELTSFLQ